LPIFHVAAGLTALQLRGGARVDPALLQAQLVLDAARGAQLALDVLGERRARAYLLLLLAHGADELAGLSQSGGGQGNAEQQSGDSGADNRQIRSNCSNRSTISGSSADVCQSPRPQRTTHRAGWRPGAPKAGTIEL